MTALSLADVDRHVAALRSTTDVISANLVELDGDVTRRTLDGARTLTGETARLWPEARARFADLWVTKLALDETVAEIVEARGRGGRVPRASLELLSRLLTGPAVRLRPAAPQPSARGLLTASVPETLATIDEAVARMAADYQAVAPLVARASEVWIETVPALVAAQDRVEAYAARASAAGVREPNELATARRVVADALATARSDPLGVREDLVALARSVLARVEATLDAELRRAAEVGTEAAAVQGLLDDCRRRLEVARQSRESVADRILLPPGDRGALDDLSATVQRLQDELSRLGTGASLAQVADLRARAAATRSRVEAATGAGQDGLAVREELRGRLDAYRAKAHAQGRSEDMTLGRLYRGAADLLYSAPCDLARAEQAVAAYQRAVREPRPGEQVRDGRR